MDSYIDIQTIGWDKVRTRQLERLPLVHEWKTIANIKEGDSLLDIGPGPGVFLYEYASMVGKSGTITALEKSDEAIHILNSSPLPSNVKVIQTDLEAGSELELGSFNVILVTDVLHHVKSPSKLLENLSNYISDSTVILISEFSPNAAGRIGPPISSRISQAKVRQIVSELGYRVVLEGEQSYEHYYLLFQKS